MVGLKRICLVFAAALASAGAADVDEIRVSTTKYTPAPALQLSVQTTLVEAGITVRDRRGNALGGFTAADFTLLDEGRPQVISHFNELRAPHSSPAGQTPTPSAPAPRTIALYFDDTHATSFSLQQSRVAAQKVVASLESGDRAGIFTDSGTVTLDFTSESTQLLEALSRVRQHPKAMGSGMGVCPAVSPYQAYAVSHGLDEEARQQLIRQAIACNCLTGEPECIREQPSVVQTVTATAWDTYKPQSAASLDVLQLVVNHLATAPGTRILALLSAGFVSGGLDKQKNAILDAALRGRIVINALNSSGLETARRASQQTMTEFMAGAAAGTGGEFLENTNDISGGLRRLTAIPEVSYLAGFQPQAEPDGKLHALKVALKKPEGAKVESRTAYFSTPAPPAKENAQQRIDRLAAARDSVNELPVTLTIAREGDNIRVAVAVDAAKLRFVLRGDRNVQQVTFATVIEDAAGHYLEGKQSVMDLALLPASLERLQAEGIRTTMTFAAPKVPYQIREVVREAADNHLYAATHQGAPK